MNKFKDKLEAYQKMFGLDNWTIDLTTSPLEKEHSARTLADPRYNQASMTITPQTVANESSYDDIIVHELIHIVMAMYDYFADNLGKEGTDELFFIAREKSVSELTHIFMRIIKNENRGTN